MELLFRSFANRRQEAERLMTPSTNNATHSTSLYNEGDNDIRLRRWRNISRLLSCPLTGKRAQQSITSPGICTGEVI